MRFRERGIRRARDGGYAVRLEADERELLASLPALLRAAIDADDPSTARLFPPAYDDDPDGEQEYRSLVRDGLRDAKLGALEVFERTAGADRLSTEDLEAWLGAIESLRLVLGTQLDVKEDTYATALDPANPDTPRLALYAWLSWLQEEVVTALTASLPDR
ncbi:MAG: DUF2017 family protein [Actinobacteria bacterium]|nr:DUF2017 family protein [Actinomycetota bacterium]